jgi:hypothetical protein
MLTLSGSLKVFVAVEPCDMRKSSKRRVSFVSYPLHEVHASDFWLLVEK